MSSLGHLAEPEQHELLTVQEASGCLRVGRTLGYQLACDYLRSGGTDWAPGDPARREVPAGPSVGARRVDDDRPAGPAV